MITPATPIVNTLTQLSHTLGQAQSLVIQLSRHLEEAPRTHPLTNHYSYLMMYRQEIRQQAETLDRRYADLLRVEQFWLQIYHDHRFAPTHDVILHELDATRQRMTDVMCELDATLNQKDGASYD